MASISIIIRVENPTNNLKDLAIQLDKVASGSKRHNFEFVYVDNGSGDESFEALKEISRTDRRIRVVRLTRKFGDSEAALAGITYSTGDCMAMITEGSTLSLAALANMIAKWEMGSKIVLGISKDSSRNVNSPRRSSHLLKGFLQRFSVSGYIPADEEYLLIDRQIAEIVLRSFEPGATIGEILSWSGFKPAFVEFSHDSEESAPITRPDNRFLFGSTGMMVGIKSEPIKLSSRLSLVSAIVLSAIGIGLVTVRILNPNITYDVDILIAIVLLALGLQSISSGVAGVYAGKTLMACSSRPNFIVESLINEPVTNLEAREKVEKLLLTLTSGARWRKRGEQ
jgi:dolichol-phosphate mannosyltransferase